MTSFLLISCKYLISCIISGRVYNAPWASFYNSNFPRESKKVRFMERIELWNVKTALIRLQGLQGTKIIVRDEETFEL